MRWPELGLRERRWEKKPGEELRPAKTWWDVFQLLIVPVMIAVIAVAFNAAETSRDRSRADRQLRQDRALAEATGEDATLNSYLSQMSNLMLKQHLLDAHPGAGVASVARTITLTALRRLNGDRRAEVLRFLLEAGLVGRNRSPVSLRGADLRDADFRGERLGHVGLRTRLYGVDLRGAKFDGASILNVLIDDSDIRRASFARAALIGVQMTGSDLTGSVFDDANLVPTPTPTTGNYRVVASSLAGSCLTNASFARAFLNRVDFNNVEGRGLDFTNTLFRNPKNTKTAILTRLKLDGSTQQPDGWTGHGTANRGYQGILAAHPCHFVRGPIQFALSP